MFTLDVNSISKEASGKILKEIREKRRELLDTIGVQLLSLVLLAFDDKSRGGAGDDGITWEPLHPDTIKAKQKRGKGRKKSKRSRRGSGGGLSGPTGSSSTLIGVDSGLMRASSTPGYRGKDRVYKINESTDEVTVGFGRSYAEYFDEDRQLLPYDLPVEWEQDLDEIIEIHFEEILQEFEE